MKKLYILGFSLLVFACADDINDVRPSDQLEVSDFFSTASDFDAALGGAFQQLQNYYALELLIVGDVPTDNVIQAQTGRQSNDVYWDWRYTSLNDIGLMDEGYEAVNISNNIIANIEVLPEGDVRDNIVAQALTIRALAHFDMGRVYGQIPTQSAGANASLGLPYIRFEDGDTGDPFAQPARETVSSNYTEIIADLNQALTLVDETSIENAFTAEAIHGLLSRIHLYNGDYAASIASANQVTTAVAPAADLLNVFRDASTSGLLMKLGIDATLDNLSAGVVWSQSSTTNTISEYAMSFDLFSSLDPNDIRSTAFVFTGNNEGNDYNAVNKWIGETGQINGRTDMPVIRVAEVLLNKAEAQFENGDEDGALATLDQLRDARYTAYAGGETGAALETAIRFERRIEMFTEYSRFFDIKRWGLGINRGTAGDFADGTGTEAEFQTLSAGDGRFQLAIPQTEIQANPNFEQNPGYTSTGD